MPRITDHYNTSAYAVDEARGDFGHIWRATYTQGNSAEDIIIVTSSSGGFITTLRRVLVGWGIVPNLLVGLLMALVLWVVAWRYCMPRMLGTESPSSPTTSTTVPLASDLTGTWVGIGVYYTFDLFGERSSKVTADVVLTLTQDGDTVTGILNVYPTEQVPIGQELYVPELEGHSEISGTVSMPTITFYVGSLVAGTKEEWEFTVDTDTKNSMSGQVTNLDTGYYLGRDSDPKAFNLAR